MADPDYFTLAEFRTLPDCTGSLFSDAQINAAAAHFVSIVEREVFGEGGEGFIPREFTVTLDGSGRSAIILPHAHISAIDTITVDDVAVLPVDLAYANGILRYLAGTYWTYGVANIVVTYTAGKYATCPPDVKDAVMWATRDRLLSQSDQAGIDVRRTSMNTEYGTVNYVIPGEKRPTGYPELDALIASYQRTTPSYGFA